MNYDGIILAAGRNSRLKGLVPSYYKPLVVVNGKPLIVSLVQRMLTYCGKIIVVVSPENCGPIAEILEDNNLYNTRVNLIIQNGARGPGDGLFRGLLSASAERILLACGDNMIPMEDFRSAIESDRHWHRNADSVANAVTVSTVLMTDEGEASRFTRTASSLNHFIENTPGGQWEDHEFRCWIGPFIFDRVIGTKLFAEEVLSYGVNTPEIKISPIFNKITNLLIRPIYGHSVDVGTSDSLLENTSDRT